MTKNAKKQIVLIKGADRVRLRPAVIFGSSGVEGCVEAVKNIIKNSVNEAKAGYGNDIIVKRFADGLIEITDFGRGIPVEYDEEEGEYAWRLNFCEIFAGSKFKNDRDESKYGGISLCATQYATEYMDATIYREDKKYTLHFEKGEIVGEPLVAENSENKKGTTLKFKLDNAVFDDTDITFDLLDEVVSEYAKENTEIRFEMEYYEADNCIKKSAEQFRTDLPKCEEEETEQFVKGTISVVRRS